MPVVATTSGFSCQECGHKFRTIKAAEKAAFGADGCPKCGSSDIDLTTTITHDYHTKTASVSK